MKAYHHIPLTPDNVVVFPSRAVAIENALQLFSPALAIVDEHLTRHLPKQWLTSSTIEERADCTEAENIVTVIESPLKWDLLIEFIRKLKPQVVVTGMAQFDAISTAAFVNLLNVTKDVGSWLFLDISEHLELSRVPSSNSVLRYLAGNTLPSHVAILCGLVKNQVYSDLEVAFTISEQAAFCEALSQTVELLEGHTSVISQQYYGCLLHQLLAFRICEPHAQQERRPALVLPQRMIGFSNSAISAIKEAEFFLPDTKKSCVIHMDLDRNFLPIPSAVKASIFESFVRQNIMDSETDVRSSIQRLLKRNYNYLVDSNSDIIYGNTSLALFNKLVRRCVQERGIFVFPLGTNGHYVSAAKFLNKEPFSRAWVYISGPTINPSGFLYSAKEIEELLSICARNAARVVTDTSFSGLEFQTDDWPFPGVQFPFNRWPCWDLEGCLDDMAGHVAPVYLLGELSLELTMAGLKFGFLISEDRSLEYSFPILSQPHSTLKYTFRKLLGLKYELDEHFSNLIAEQRETTLESCGWDVVGCHGGILMLAKPTTYIGKLFRVNGFEGTLNGCNIREALLRSTRLCISSSTWTGITDYCRFSFALESGEFKRAMDCITRFKELVLGG
uniref:Aminotransferase class I/classII large domain-containing protein n=1 Tax=Aegilops tauschii subsp. strangulata TaxID=200361 RepID=A0A453QGM5_AEGTS